MYPFAATVSPGKFSLRCLITFFLFLLLQASGGAQPPTDPANPVYIQPKDRITRYIDDEQRITLRGNLHPLARPEYDAGAVAPGFRLERMLLSLLPDAVQQESLNQFVEAQHNPESANYHQWLTPDQFGERFGVSEGDAAQIVGWLQSRGMEVEEVTAGRRSIIFSGSAAQVQAAFHTQVHNYMIGGQLHHANATEPQIPAALMEVVGGVVSLHDFHSEPLHASVRKAATEFSSGGSHYLAPGDFATIYDLGPLYQSSINGSGQSVAIVARSNINLNDVRQFRSMFGLPANDPQIIVNGTDPGISSSGEETEADLDVEWSGAVAKNAAIKFVVSKSTNSSDGVDLSAQYIVNHNLAPVMSTSFGLCETSLGSAGNSFLNSLWQQAAAEGITVFVSSGDNGAAGCDSASASLATHGRGVNGLCSTPYSICVGGTEFNDTPNPALYWSSSNASGTQVSAVSYIPELVWNESGPGAGLWSSGGGTSTLYAKPSWQTGAGIPSDGRRDVPDVSLTSAGHEGYLIVQNGGLYVVGGTSAASPSFAGVMALVVQNAAARQGNANTALYPLATKQRAGGASVFHDIVTGNNSVPGQSGFSATTGYDQATGLGSIDASVLVNHWSDAYIVPSFRMALPSSSLSVTAGSNNSVSASVTVSGGFNAAVTVSVTGLPPGVSAVFTPATLSAPGAGRSVLNLAASTSAKPGIYSLMVAANSGALKQTATLSLTVAPTPTFTLASSATSISLVAGTTKTLTLTTSPNSTFNSAVVLTVSGLPAGLTAQFLPASVIAAPGGRATTVTFATTSNLSAKTYSITLTATGGGVTERQIVTVNVPSISLGTSASGVTVSSTVKGTLKVTTAGGGGFASPISLSISGLPAGVTASFSPQTVASPGNGSSTITLSKAGTATGSSHFTVTASGGGITQGATIGLTVK
jgi:pseudomonalisin